MKRSNYIAIAIIMLAVMACKEEKIKYPAAPVSETTDDYFGIKVEDRFRPLENDTASATLEWVEAQREITQNYLSKITYREDIKNRLTELNNYVKTGLPSKEKDGMYYFYENDGLRNQHVLYRSKTADGKDKEVFLDPNTLSEDGTVALTGISFSKDGKYTAYTISRSGSDWTEIYVMETATKKLLEDHIQWTKFTGASWCGDGFFYSAYDKPEEGKEFSNANEYHKVYYHKIGTSQEQDVIAFENKQEPLHFHQAQVANDENVMFIYGSGQGMGNSIKMKNLKKSGEKWIVMEPSQDYNQYVVGVVNDKIYILTSFGAPKYKLMVASVNAPQRDNWRDLVPEQDGVLVNVQFAGEKMLLTYDKDASNQVYVYDLNGNKEREIKLPTYGTVGISSDRDHSEVYYGFSSFVYPSATYEYDLSTGESTFIRSAEISGFNSEDYVTEQVFYTSVDSTKIPMFITYKKGLKRDKSNPVYLYGYGGFNITLNPGFSAQRILWLENGGIYAQANLRGGGEYGEEWHEAGTKMKKLNVFNDFIAATEYMINEGWTSPEKIVVEGGSNGGLLVGAVVNMRPDLFRVAIPRVGVMDMMRYHLFTIGWNWASDYGTSADSKEMAQYLLDYSPMHNIKNDGTPYPAIMVTTADHDDRVVPAHSFKYAAVLQASNTGDAPKIIRIDSKAGHGAGKPIAKVLDEYADIYSFIYYNMGIDPTKK